ncbi:hypothetical protein IKN40_05825 [bacterium]|nr:hypothetical protein [bacterium]
MYDHVSLIRSKNLDFSKLLDVKGFFSNLMNKIEISFDDLSFDFFKKKVNQETGDVQILS